MFSPVNRYILIKMPPKVAERDSTILLPEDYKPEEQQYAEVSVIKAADDANLAMAFTGIRHFRH